MEDVRDAHSNAAPQKRKSVMTDDKMHSFLSFSLVRDCQLTFLTSRDIIIHTDTERVRRLLLSHAFIRVAQQYVCSVLYAALDVQCWCTPRSCGPREAMDESSMVS